MQRAVDFNHKNKGGDRMPSIAKKRLLRKKYKKTFVQLRSKDKTAETSGSVFAERIEKGKKAKFESELMKIVDCFLFS